MSEKFYRVDQARSGPWTRFCRDTDAHTRIRDLFAVANLLVAMQYRHVDWFNSFRSPLFLFKHCIWLYN